jgi:hypothetical protein
MEYSTGKRIGAFLLVLLHVWSVPMAMAATVCTSSSSTGSVLSVIGNGTISIASGACNVQFYGVSTVGAKQGNYTEPEAGKCNEYSSDGSAVGTVSASGVSSSARTLADWEESTSNASFKVPENTTISFGYYDPNATYDWQSFVSTSSVSAKTDATYTQTASGQSISVTKKGNVYTVAGGDYGIVEVDNGTSVVFTGPVRIKKLVVSNNGSVTFAPDSTAATPSKTWIDEFSLSSATSLYLSGTTTTTLNILGKNYVTGVVSGWSIGSQVCINYLDCDPNSAKTYANMAEQHPELLQINVYNGNLVTQGSFALAAGLYVANGAANFSNGSPVTIVGEVLANSISLQNNNSTQLFYKSTTSVALQSGSYSLTPPASDSIITGGSYVYRAMQRDYLSDNTTAGTSGHLMKFALKDDTTQESTATWDAAALMTTSDRQTKIYTENAQGNFILLQNATADILTDGTQTAKVACIINPNCENGAYLAGRDSTSLVGTPWRTYPILIGDSQLASDGSANAAYKGGSVLFATDDGILYSVDRDTGALNWGWIPAKVVPMTATPASLILKHPWGQISSMSLYKTGSDGTLAEHTYVTGTALGGQLHFTIEVDNYGKSLKSVVWQDYRAGKYSPGSDAWGGIAGRPYGGAAPTAQVGGTGKVAYVVGNQLVTRQIDDTSTTVPTAYSFVWYSDDHTSGAPYWDESTMRVSSNLIYMGDSAIYFGGSNGRVWQATSLGHLKSGAVNIDLSLDGTEAITFLNGATTTSTGGNSLILLAQSTSRVTTLKYLNNVWSYNWYISVGAATGTNPYIPSANNAYISAPSDISNGSVYLYYTTKDSTGCDVKGYEFGPISLENGSSKLSSLVVGTTTSLSSYIGPGEAVGGIVAEWYSSTAKKLYVGVLAATAGTPSGGSSSSSGSSSTGTSTASLSTNAQTLFLGQNATSTTTRVNWRELTNFF